MNRDTKKIEHGKTLMIAHRGLSGIEPENTVPAFTAAGNRSYFGIETDVHVTRDGKYIIIHDDDTGRVFERSIPVEGSDFAELRSLSLNEKFGGAFRSDAKMPELAEYIAACARYGKTAVLELKNRMTPEQVAGICGFIESTGYMENVIFISFIYENLVSVRKLYPEQREQFLVGEVYDGLIEALRLHNFGIDIYHVNLSEEQVKLLHENGIEVNCWTVDDPEDAKKLVSWGVDYITTDIIE